MSCTSPRTVASTIRPFPDPSTRSMCGSRWLTAAFIVSALCSTNGSCIFPDPNSSPTTFIPSSRCSLMIVSASISSSASSRSPSSPRRSPSMMRCFSRSSTGSAACSSARFGAASTSSNSERKWISGS